MPHINIFKIKITGKRLEKKREKHNKNKKTQYRNTVNPGLHGPLVEPFAL